MCQALDERAGAQRGSVRYPRSHFRLEYISSIPMSFVGRIPHIFHFSFLGLSFLTLAAAFLVMYSRKLGLRARNSSQMLWAVWPQLDSMASYIWAEPCHGVRGDHARLAWYTVGCTGGRGPAGHPIQRLVAPWVSPEPQPGVLSADKPSPSPASMEAEATAAKPSPKRSEPPPHCSAGPLPPLPLLSIFPQPGSPELWPDKTS